MSAQEDGGGQDPSREPVWRRYQRFYRPDLAADLDDELRDHLTSTVEALVAEGFSPADAAAEALRRFGDVRRVRRDVQRLDARHFRRLRRAAWFDALIADVRYGARGLRRAPLFTLVAAVSIALGVAANATVFSVVNAALLRPIPGTHAPRLARVYVNHHGPFAWEQLDWFRDRAGALEHLVGERNSAVAIGITSDADVERVRAAYVTQGYFGALGVPMALGRPFDVRDRDAGEASILVVGHSYWKQRFAGDSGIVGRTVLIGDLPMTVAGVASPEFTSSVVGWSPQIILPIAALPALTGTPLESVGGSLYTTARLRPAVRRSAAQAQLNALMAQLQRTDSSRYERTTVRLDHVRGVNAELRMPLVAASLFLMGLVAVVLLIACANVALLLLGRAAARRTEFGVRLAIGAGRGRIVRQMLTESVLLAALGGAAGLAMTVLLIRLLGALIPAEVGLDASFFVPDRRVLAFTAALCAFSVLLCGLVPALRASSPRLMHVLRGDEDGRRRHLGRSKLVAAQAALCVVLLAIAAMFARSLQSITGLDPGFAVEGVVDAALDLSLLGGSPEEERALFDRVLDRARTLPGVESATLAAVVPLTGNSMETRVLPEGTEAASRFDAPFTHFNVIAPAYFETLHIPLRQGREFMPSDGPAAQRVAIVNETAAARWFHGESPLGRRLRWGGVDGPELEVIGVARDVSYNMPGEAPRPFVYLPLAQQHRSEMVLHLRTGGGPEAIRSVLYDALREVAPALPPPPTVPMSRDVAVTLLPIRAGALAIGAFGALALLLASAGIYGVASYSIARRTRELGIRAALGATRARLLRMVVGDSVRTVAAGAAIGSLLALGAAFGLSRVLYGVRPIDPLVLSGVALVLGVVAVLASLMPAARAARVDPVRAIRAE